MDKECYIRISNRGKYKSDNDKKEQSQQKHLLNELKYT
jgi:hypothetical protein